ncbi:MAG: hypothetical protein SO267_15545 [Lachnospiraceae bacterium]|nr:hypothetical protein [Lachnospiraceae bacterium]
MDFQGHRTIINGLKRQLESPPSYESLSYLLAELQYAMDDNPEITLAGRDFIMAYSGYIKKWAANRYSVTGDRQWDKLYWDTMLFEAPYLLDSYCLYIEKNRKPQQRFYEPRRKTLIKVVNKLQMLEDDQLDELFIHMPARVGKTQIITMGISWHCCRNTELSNLYCSYKEDAGGAFLDGVKEIWTDPVYCHQDVFPKAKIVDTDAKANTVDLERKKKYKSLSGKGLTSGLNGLYDATGWLIADDILEGIQDVLSPDVLRRKQTIFDNNLMKRKKEKCKVIYNGTIWSLHDIYMNRLSFLENNPEAKDVRWDVLKIPALDPETDESNFDYDYNLGFSTKYYRIERAKFEENDDMASWFSQCQQEPIERDGAVFNPEHMNFYNGVLPNEEPVKIVSACDVALGGSDYLAMPVAYVYSDGSVYIHDVVFDNSEKTITQPKVVQTLIKNQVSNAFFEANAGGEMYKDEIDKMLQEKGVKVNLVSKFAQQMILVTGGSASKTHQRKEQRIWDNAQAIRNFYFRDSGYQNIEYRKFMNNVYSFTINGKNKNDDAPDSLASLAVFIAKGSGTSAEVKVMRRLF